MTEKDGSSVSFDTEEPCVPKKENDAMSDSSKNSPALVCGKYFSSQLDLRVRLFNAGAGK